MRAGEKVLLTKPPVARRSAPDPRSQSGSEGSVLPGATTASVQLAPPSPVGTFVSMPRRSSEAEEGDTQDWEKADGLHDPLVPRFEPSPPGSDGSLSLNERELLASSGQGSLAFHTALGPLDTYSHVDRNLFPKQGSSSAQASSEQIARPEPRRIRSHVDASPTNTPSAATNMEGSATLWVSSSRPASDPVFDDAQPSCCQWAAGGPAGFHALSDGVVWWSDGHGHLISVHEGVTTVMDPYGRRFAWSTLLSTTAIAPAAHW